MTYIEFLSNINSVTSSLKSDIKILENYVKSVVEEVEIFDISEIKQKLKSKSFGNNSNNYDQLNNLLKKDIEETINEYVESSLMEIEDKCKDIENLLNE